MQDLPKVGAQLSLEGTSKFLSDAASVNQRLNELQQSVQRLSSGAGANAQALNDFRNSVANIGSGAAAGASDLNKLRESVAQLVPATGQAARALREEGVAADEVAKSQQAATVAIARSAGAHRELEAAVRQVTVQQQASAQAAGAFRVSQQQAAAAASQQGNAFENTTIGALNYYRMLTAIHSVNNLLGVSSLNVASNIATTGLSLSQFGASGIAVGVGIGAAAAAVGVLANAFETVKNAAIGTVEVVGKVAVGAAAVIGAAAVKSVEFAATYEQQMAFIEALTGATNEELLQLNETIIGIARTTTVGMPEAAKAITELAKAGVDIPTIINGAADAVIALTIASNGELGAAGAARAVAQGLNTWGPAGTTAIEVANAITAAAQGSTLSFTEITQAFQQAGPAARTLKIPIEDLSVAIAILGNNGLRGSVAGTSFKQVLLDLEKPSKQATELLKEANVSLFNLDGSIRPLRAVFNDLNQAFGEAAVKSQKLTEAESAHALAVIFGARAGLAANIITNEGVAAFDKMADSLEGIKATDMEAVMLRPLNARIEILKNNVGILANAFGQMLLPAISDIVNKGLMLIQSLDPKIFETLGQAVVALASEQGFGALVEKISALTDNEGLANFIIELANTFRILAGTITTIVLPAITDAWDTLFGGETDWEGLTANVRALGGAIAAIGTLIADLITGFVNLVVSIRDNAAAMEFIKDAAIGLAAVIGGSLIAAFIAIAVPIGIVIAVLAGVGFAIRGLITVIENFGEFWATAWTVIADIFVTFGKFIVDQALNALTGGFADSFTEILRITAEFVNNFATTTKGTEEPLAGLAEAVSEVPTGFASAFSEAGRITAAFLSWCGEQIGRFIGWLASQPIFGEAVTAVAGYAAGFIIGGPVLANMAASAAPLIRNAFSAVKTEMASLQVVATNVQSRFDNLGGSLTGLFANIAAGAAKARGAIEDMLKEPPPAPTGSPFGGGGGGGGKGGGGRGGGAGGAEKKTALQGFMEELANDAIKFKEQLGKIGGELAADLVDAIRDGTEAGGKKVATAMVKLVDALKAAGVENVSELQSAMRNSLQEALTSGSQDAIDAAVEAIRVSADALVDATSFSSMFKKLSAKATQSNELSEALGESGAEAFVALTEGFEKAGPEAAKSLNSALDKVRNDMRKANLPNWRATWDELWQLALIATETGGEEVVQAFKDKLAAIEQAIEQAKPKAKTAVQSFMRAVSDVAKDDDFVKRFGEAGAVAAQFFTAEFDSEAARISAAGQVGNSLQKMIHAAEKAGVPQAAALGQNVIAAVATAMVDSSEDARAAANQAIQSLFDATKLAEATAKIEDIVEKAMKSIKMKLSPKEGGGFMNAFFDSVNDVVKEQTPKTVDNMFDFAQKIVTTLEKGLPPEKAAEAIAEFIRLLNAAVREHTPEAAQALHDFVTQYTSILEEDLGSKLQTSLNKIWTDAKAAVQPMMVNFMDAVRGVIIDKAPESEASMTKFAQNILAILFKKASPQDALLWGQKFMDVIKEVLKVGGEAGIEILTNFLNEMNGALGLGLNEASATVDKFSKSTIASLNDMRAALGTATAPGGGFLPVINGSANFYTSRGLADPYAPGGALNYANQRSPGVGSNQSIKKAEGGWLTEPIFGWGQNSGMAYQIAEQGAEYLSPGDDVAKAIHQVEMVLTSIAKHEIMPMGGGGRGGNSYSYNVNASYSRVQSEASVAQDLRALVAMSAK